MSITSDGVHVNNQKTTKRFVFKFLLEIYQASFKLRIFSRPYGRALMLQCCVRLYGMYCGLTVRPRVKVTIDSL